MHTTGQTAAFHFHAAIVLVHLREIEVQRACASRVGDANSLPHLLAGIRRRLKWRAPRAGCTTCGATSGATSTAGSAALSPPRRPACSVW